jgi:CBS domain containing-hemolysin-like protein
LQVQLEEEKLKPTSHTTGSVFIDGVEFVKVSFAVVLPMILTLCHSFNSRLARRYPSSIKALNPGVLYLAIQLLPHALWLRATSLHSLFVLQRAQVDA